MHLYSCSNYKVADKLLQSINMFPMNLSLKRKSEQEGDTAKKMRPTVEHDSPMSPKSEQDKVGLKDIDVPIIPTNEAEMVLKTEPEDRDERSEVASSSTPTATNPSSPLIDAETRHDENTENTREGEGVVLSRPTPLFDADTGHDQSTENTREGEGAVLSRPTPLREDERAVLPRPTRKAFSNRTISIGLDDTIAVVIARLTNKDREEVPGIYFSSFPGSDINMKITLTEAQWEVLKSGMSYINDGIRFIERGIDAGGSIHLGQNKYLELCTDDWPYCIAIREKVRTTEGGWIIKNPGIVMKKREWVTLKRSIPMFHLMISYISQELNYHSN